MHFVLAVTYNQLLSHLLPLLLALHRHSVHSSDFSIELLLGSPFFLQAANEYKIEEQPVGVVYRGAYTDLVHILSKKLGD
jgi:hypothetical protein